MGSDGVTLFSEFHPEFLSDQFAGVDFCLHPLVSPPVK